MDSWIALFVIFTLVGGIFILVILLNSQSGSSSLKVGQAELKIDFDRGWQKKPHLYKRSRNDNPAPNCWLEVKGTKWRYPLYSDRHIYIGRRADNQIRLKDPTTDMRQAVIYWEDNRYKINNLSLKIPTQVNNRVMVKQNLGNGNTIQMGSTKLIFRQTR